MRARYYVPILCVFAPLCAAASSASSAQIKVDEARSAVVLRTNTYDVSLAANSSEAISAVTLELQVLDPKGAVMASSSSRQPLRRGLNRLAASVVLPRVPKQRDDLLWYRLVYRIVGANDEDLATGILPLFKSVDDFALHVSAPATVEPGKRFFVRVRTTHPVLAVATPGVVMSVQLRLSVAGTVISHASARTDARGYAVVPVKLPADFHEHYVNLHVEAQRGSSKKTAENELNVGAPTQILVETDKPLYQPGQVLHIRAIAFGDEHRAVAGKKLYVEIEDEDDTVIFRQRRTTSRFGVIAADWTTPDRVKLGEYRVIAKTYAGRHADDDEDDDAANPVTASADRKVVRISRYELPAFVVNAKPDRSYYLLGQKPAVEISAAYLFGKPVPKAKVRISRVEDRHWNFAEQKWETEEHEAVEGESDENGVFRGTLDVSKQFADLDEYYYLKFRDVSYTAYVTDPSTARTEQRRFDVRVTKYPIHVYYVGEGSYWGVADEFFISTSYADGSAAECNVEVRTMSPDGSGERVIATAHTNRYGVARIRGAKESLTNGDREIPLIMVARDRKGATGVTKDNLWVNSDVHKLRVVTNKTIFAPGEAIEAEIRSNTNGELIVELANEWQVLRSFTVRVRGHHAYVRIPYSPEFTGELTLTAADMEGGSGWRPRDLAPLIR